MASREFIDSAGEHWLVWDTRPTTRAWLDPSFETGWLTFGCGSQLRRLAPTPDGWETLPDRELERLCRSATPVERRRTPPRAIDTPPERRDEPRP
jgi:hypothetical protein